MGYTHYYRMQPGVDPKLEDVAPDIAALISNSRVSIVGPMGKRDTAPELSSEGILLNGYQQHSYETFHYPSYNFAFCKTARKPYDEVEVSSDGDPDDEQDEWGAAIDLFRDTFPDRDFAALLPAG